MVYVECELVDAVLEACRSVHDALKHTHSEAVYHRALEVELRLRGIAYESETIVPVQFKNHCVGHVRLDLIIDKRYVVELKSTPSILPAHEDQVRKYLILCKLTCGLIINFGTPTLQSAPITLSVDKAT